MRLDHVDLSRRAVERGGWLSALPRDPGAISDRGWHQPEEPIGDLARYRALEARVADLELRGRQLACLGRDAEAAELLSEAIVSRALMLRIAGGRP